ncbi:MAG: hypothetical protein ABL921_25955 [Pirellula sp.]
MRKLRPIHFVSFSLPGRVSYFASPEHKPYTKKGKKHPMLQDDPDLVNIEFETKLADYQAYPAETIQRAGPVLANRINTRRAIRELILPELAMIQSTLADIQKRLDRIETDR